MVVLYLRAGAERLALALLQNIAETADLFLDGAEIAALNGDTDVFRARIERNAVTLHVRVRKILWVQHIVKLSNFHFDAIGVHD